MAKKKKKGTILVVDDDNIIVKLITKYLEIEDFVVFNAYNGEDALKALKSDMDEFDLVILDLVMPNVDGYEVCRAIREKKTLYELPIIILTAENNTQDIIKGFNSGANDYLAKPFNGFEMAARAKTLITLKKMTRSNDVLQEAISMKNQFLHITVHDLKNPLNVITGLAKMMKKDFAEDSDNFEMLDLITESSDLMLDLINELLEAAKIESGKLALNMSPVNLNESVENAYAKNLATATKKEQKIIMDTCDDEIAFIMSDSIRLHEIIDNLVSNAIKYSPMGKTITIKTLLPEENGKKEIIRLIVKDEGPGLNDDDMKKIFGQFQKLSARPTAGEASSGLGLSIVKKLVELHNAGIYVESEVGKGSSFIVEFKLIDLAKI